MDKNDLIYDTVLRIEKRFDEELKPIKQDIECLKEFKNKILGVYIAGSVIGSFALDFIKQIFFNR